MKDENNLRVRSKEFARRIIRLDVALPRTNPAAQVLGRQMLRSGTSIGANYREAQRARSKAEFVAKIGDCLREADETLYWLELLLEEKFMAPKLLEPLMKENDELLAVLTTIAKRAKGIE